MRASIKTKLLLMCIVLVLLSISGLSVAYYVITRRDKQRESQQRIQIASEIVLHDLTDRIQTYTEESEGFLETDLTLPLIPSLYQQDETQVGNVPFITSFLVRLAQRLKEFGHQVAVDRAVVYAANKRLLALYQRDGKQELVGGYVISETGSDAYFDLADPSQVSTWLVLDQKPIPDAPLPPGIAPYYEGDIPESVSMGLFTGDHTLGLRAVIPLYESEKLVGVMVSDILYTQAMVDRYALLSKIDVNLFAENHLSVGTLLAQKTLESSAIEEMGLCEDILDAQHPMKISSITFEQQDYYQGGCAFTDVQGEIAGALTISLSQDLVVQEVKKIRTVVMTISGIVLGVAFSLSLIFSRNITRSIHNIVDVIVAAAGGDLRRTAVVTSQDEIGSLAGKLNQMITQLRTITRQVQDAAHGVNAGADTILQDVNALIQHMEQQSDSVDNATVSIDKIKQFIDAVAQSTSELLSAAAQILTSIQQTRASIGEVTTSTGSLTETLYLISDSVDQVNQAVKQIAENAGQLDTVARQTDTEIRNIDQSLKDVSHNADDTQQLARETMDAATSGKASVEASMQGMIELKDVVSHTAQIIREVNSWGEQVSSILNIVDEITEQTSLLALNASIISAQAGVHGRGFAVVAEEIKELATRTKTSTQEIGTLIRELRKKTEEGVEQMTVGLSKTDQEMELARAVKESLTTILERATHSSNRAADTAQVVQQTVASSQVIRAQMNNVTDMVSKIRTAIQDQKHDIEQVVSAVENISGTSEEVNRANLEQKRSAEEIERSMEEITDAFSELSERTDTLQQYADQIVIAMHTIESTAEQTLHNANAISGETVKSLVQQSDALQKTVEIFKIS